MSAIWCIFWWIQGISPEVKLYIVCFYCLVHVWKTCRILQTLTAASLLQSVVRLTSEREVLGLIPGAGPILRVFHWEIKVPPFSCKRLGLHVVSMTSRIRKIVSAISAFVLNTWTQIKCFSLNLQIASKQRLSAKQRRYHPCHLHCLFLSFSVTKPTRLFVENAILKQRAFLLATKWAPAGSRARRHRAYCKLFGPVFMEVVDPR